MLLLHLLRWLRQHSDLPFEVVTREGGPLLPDFKAVAPTCVLARQGRTRTLPVPERLRREWVLSRLGAKGSGPIYANTCTNGIELDVLSRLQRPVITHVHELDAVITLCGEDNWAAVKRHTRHFIAASRAVKGNLVSRRGIDPQRVTVIHEFIPIPTATAARDELRRKARQELALPADARMVTACGPTNWRKAPDLFLLLARSVIARRPDLPVHFIWVGHALPDELARLRHDVRHMSLNGRVHFVGERVDAPEIFGGSDVFALVSREDPFPLVCLEAASLGVPIVCFNDAGGAVELVEADVGFSVPYLDVEAMADRTVALLDSDDLTRRLGEQGARKVRERHDVTIAAPKILQVIRDAMR